MAKRYSIVIETKVKGAGQASRGIKSVAGAAKLAGPAIAAMGVAAVAAGAALAAVGVAKFAREAVEAYNIQIAAEKQLAAAIKSTGGVAGLSKKQLTDYATALQRVTTVGDEAIIAMQSVLLTFTGIAGDEFKRATASVVDLSERMGTDLTSAALQLGKALNAPISNLGALGRAGIQFSKEQTELIKSLASTNRLAEAQQIILAELETQFGGSAAAARDTFGGAVKALGNEWGDLLEKFGEGVEVFRPVIDDLIKILEKLNDRFPILQKKAGTALRILALGLQANSEFAFALLTLMAKLAALPSPPPAVFEIANAKLVEFIDQLGKDLVEAGTKGPDAVIKGFEGVKVAVEESTIALFTHKEAINAVSAEADKAIAAAKELADVLPFGGATIGTDASAGRGGMFAGLVLAKSEIEKLPEAVNEVQRSFQQIEPVIQDLARATTDWLLDFAATGQTTFQGLADVFKRAFAQAMDDLLAKWLSSGIGKIGSGGGGGGGGGDSSSQASSAAGGWMAVVGAFIVVFEAIDGWIKSSNLHKFGDPISIGGSGALAGGGSSVSAMPVEAERIRLQLQGLLQGILDTIGGFVDNLPDIGVAIRQDGEKFQALVGGVVLGVFSSFQEAFAAATLAAVRVADFSGVGRNVAAVLANSTAASLEQFMGEIDFAKMLDNASISEMTRSFKDLARWIDVGSKKVAQLGLSIQDWGNLVAAETAKLRASITDEIKQFLPGFDAIGEKFADLRQRTADYNAGLQQQIDILLKQIAAAAKAAGATDEAVQAIVIFGQGIHTFLTEMGEDVTFREVGEAIQNALRSVGIEGERAAASLEALLAALFGLQNKFIDPALIDEAEKNARRGGGGGRRQAREAFESTLEGIIRAALPDVERVIADFEAQVKDLEEQQKKTGASTELLQKALDALEGQLTDTLEGIGQGLLASISPAAAFRQELQAQQDIISQLRENFEDLGLSIEEVQAAIQDYIDNTTLGFRTYLAQILGDEELLRRLEILRHRLQLEQMRAQLVIMLAAGQIDPSEFLGFMDAIDRAIVAIENFGGRLLRLARELGGTAIPGGGIPTGGTSGRIDDSAARAIQRAIDRLVSSLEKLVEFQRGLFTGPLSPLKVTERFKFAKDAFDATIAGIKGGNFALFDDLPGLAQTALQLGLDALPKGSASYKDLFKEINLMLFEVEKLGLDRVDRGGGMLINTSALEREMQETRFQTVDEQKLTNKTLAELLDYLKSRDDGFDPLRRTA